MPSTSASGTWVQFFEEWGYQHAYITFSGAKNVPELDDYDFTLVGSSSTGAEVGDHIESLITGPQTWLIVYEDDDYNSKHSDKTKLYFGPNTIVQDLDSQYNFGDNIDSFQMYSSEPAGWPGASKAINATVTELAVVDEQALFATVSNDMEAIVQALLSAIPDVGGVLSSLLQIFWPSTTNPNQVWEAIQRFVIKAVLEGIESSVLSDCENELNGIERAIQLYLNDLLYTEYDGLCQLLVDRAGFFTYNPAEPATQYPTQKLPYTAVYFSLALVVFYARWRCFDQIYADAPWDQSERETKRQAFLSDLDSMNSSAIAALETMTQQAIFEQQAWARGQVGSGKLNDVEGFLYLQQFCVNLRGWLAPAYLWPSLSSTGGAPVSTYFEAVSGPFGGAENVSGGGHERDVAPEGHAITRVLIRCGSRVDGLQIWIDGVAQPLRGASSGSDVSDVTLSEGEVIVAAFGFGGNLETGTLSQLYFRTNLGRNFGGGTPASTSYQAVFPQGVDACLVGYTCALQPSVLNSVSLIWRYQLPASPGFDPLAGLDLPSWPG